MRIRYVCATPVIRLLSRFRLHCHGFAAPIESSGHSAGPFTARGLRVNDVRLALARLDILSYRHEPSVLYLLWQRVAAAMLDNRSGVLPLFGVCMAESNERLHASSRRD